MKDSFSRILILLMLLLCTVGQAPAKEAQDASTVEPRVEEVLRQMSELLAKSSSFAFKAVEIVDEVLDSGFKAELSHTRTIALRRPDTARFLSWNLSPELEDDLFVFKAPDGAHKMEARSLLRSTTSAQEKKP